MGSRGAAAFTRDARYHQPAVPTANVVDTLGAGDAFIGATLAGMLRDEPLEDMLRAAASSASTTCQSYGAFGYPSPLADSSFEPPVETGPVSSQGKKSGLVSPVAPARRAI